MSSDTIQDDLFLNMLFNQQKRKVPPTKVTSQPPSKSNASKQQSVPLPSHQTIPNEKLWRSYCDKWYSLLSNHPESFHKVLQQIDHSITKKLS